MKTVKTMEKNKGTHQVLISASGLVTSRRRNDVGEFKIGEPTSDSLAAGDVACEKTRNY